MDQGWPSPSKPFESLLRRKLDYMRSVKSSVRMAYDKAKSGGKKGKKLLLCHHEGGGNFRSICIRKKKISGHLRNHPEDYCGKCEATITTSR